MVPEEKGPLEGVGEESEIIKPTLQPGIQLPAGNPSPTLGAASPDVQSQRSSLDRPRSRSRDVRSPAPRSGTDGSGDEARDIIVQSFAPRVSVYTSPDADELIRLKGLYGGLCALLRPFGEAVSGKVVVRDSTGSSKSWTDFGISFTEFDRSNGYMAKPHRPSTTSSVTQSQYLESDGVTEEAGARSNMFNEVVQTHTQAFARQNQEERELSSGDRDASMATPHFRHFLHRLLADRDMVPHETFTHPVACVIAVTAQNSTPIDTLRDLYNDTRQESDNTPSWAGNDFLRYYVLIHDDEHDDMNKSTALFNQMKRHFGLHTHLLRLRGIECSRDQPDAMPLPSCRWLSPEEELTELRQKGDLIEFDEFQQFVFGSDADAIRAFVREMVTQSVVPFMESRIATWNDQVASRRRGLSGRFMSLSKRWGGFGSVRNKNSDVPSKSNYNPTVGGYPSECNESQMHRLADYALMLRDFKLSASTYDMLRSDFGDDKAWYHHAVANELMAISLLLGTHTPRSTKVETIDQLIDTSTYSYITRCSDPFGALRCLVVMVELFRSRGGNATEEAAKWAHRLLELTILTPLMQTIVTERLALCFEAQSGNGLARFGARTRKAGLCHLLAAGAWVSQGNASNAHAQLEQARKFYGLEGGPSALPAFDGMQEYVHELQGAVAQLRRTAGAEQAVLDRPAVELVDEETKAFDDDTAATTPLRAKRFSISHQVPPSPAADMLHLLNEAKEDGFA